MEHTIELNRVRKSFGRKAVLKGVTGTVASGKVVGLLGRNGEGKTTLFRIMLDILASDGGSVSILGCSPDGSSRVRLLAGYVPERPAFHEFMTVAQVLKMRAGFFPNWDWEKANRMSRQLELDLSTHIKGASKGTLAKTAWVCATAHNPKVLLLDEPTSGLDMVVRDSVLTHLVRELADEGRTIMVANHHLEELLGILNEIWLLEDGRIRGVYELEALRNCSSRVTGRLRPGAALPASPSIVEKQRIGDMVQWLVTDKESLYRIRTLELLDNIQVEPLSLETTLRLLLSQRKTTDGTDAAELV